MIEVEAFTPDVITIGRSRVDLYGAQVGGRLEDMSTFLRYVGGSPTNMATGTARLGLRSALITRVGDEHMGRFIREELARKASLSAALKSIPSVSPRWSCSASAMKTSSR
jgi:5-dehydro-2-deoxygluconokinase